MTLREQITSLRRRLATIDSDHVSAVTEARANLDAASRLAEEDPQRARELLQLATEQTDLAEEG